MAGWAGGGCGQIWAFLTLETLARTPSGVTSPTTVTFFAAKSMLNVLTPVQKTQLGYLSVNSEEKVSEILKPWLHVYETMMLTFHLGEVLLHFAGASFAMQGHLQHNHLSNFPELSSEQSIYVYVWGFGKF